MRTPHLVALAALAALAVAAGCSSSSAGPAVPSSDAASDAGTPDAPDQGSADAGATDAAPAADAGDDAGAVTPALPQAQSAGGAVLAQPHVVPIVWASDELASDIDAFFAAFKSTTYWGDQTKEYGVAPAIVDPGVRVTDAAPATIDDTEISAWLVAHVGAGTPALPAPVPGVVYTFVYPKGTTVTMQGEKSCATFHGYHSSVALSGGTEVSYAVLSRCDSLPEVNVTGVQYVAVVASHELIEAFTDPFPVTHPAWQDTDQAHRAWALATGGELGDLCTLQGDAFYTPPDFPYTVQKIWSNAAAKAGHDPCVPQKTPYFQSAPRMSDPVAIPGWETVDGVKIPVGESREIVVDLYSDAPTSAPWTVTAREVLDSGNLQFTWDKTTGQSGDRLKLTITATKASQNGFEAFAVLSTLGNRRNLWFGAVGN